MLVAPASDLALKAVWHALGEIGVREEGPLPNRGPEVDQYLTTVGLTPSAGNYPWCAAFVFWCFTRAANDLGGIPVKCPKTASVFRMLELAAGYRSQNATPGAIFVIDHGAGKGHTGLVVAVGPQNLVTVEGNTNAEGGREGNCVAVRVRRRHDIMGYIVL